MKTWSSGRNRSRFCRGSVSLRAVRRHSKTISLAISLNFINLIPRKKKREPAKLSSPVLVATSIKMITEIKEADHRFDRAIVAGLCQFDLATTAVFLWGVHFCCAGAFWNKGTNRDRIVWETSTMMGNKSRCNRTTPLHKNESIRFDKEHTGFVMKAAHSTLIDLLVQCHSLVSRRIPRKTLDDSVQHRKKEPPRRGASVPSSMKREYKDDDVISTAYSNPRASMSRTFPPSWAFQPLFFCYLEKMFVLFCYLFVFWCLGKAHQPGGVSYLVSTFGESK